MIGNSVGKATPVHTLLADRLSKRSAILVVGTANLAIWSVIFTLVHKFL